VIALAAVPQLGLGFTLQGILGAIMILLFGFLFVTVSSRLTGEVGSSSNPISGMTIATLLLTCLIFVLVGKTTKTDPTVMLTALSVAAVVCIAFVQRRAPLRRTSRPAISWGQRPSISNMRSSLEH